MAFRRVNPPKQVVLPIEISSNPQLKKAFDDAYFIMFQLWEKTGGGGDFLADLNSNEPINHTLAKLFDIRQQIGSGIPVTIDTTGFTVDTIEQTTDKTEV